MDAQLKLFAHWLWALACQMVLSSGQMALHAGRKARGSCSSLAKVFWLKGYGYLSQLIRGVQIFLAQAVSDQTSAPLSEESDGGLDPSVDQPQEEGTQGSANPLDMTVAELQALGVSELRSIAAASNVRVPGVRPSKTTKPQLLKQLEPLARVS